MPIDPNDDETATYYPVIQFKTTEDRTIVKQLETALPPKVVGKKMAVLYNSDRPTELITYSKTKLEIVPKFMVSTGLIGLTICILEGFRIVSVIPNCAHLKK